MSTEQYLKFRKIIREKGEGMNKRQRKKMLKKLRDKIYYKVAVEYQVPLNMIKPKRSLTPVNHKQALGRMTRN